MRRALLTLFAFVALASLLPSSGGAHASDLGCGSTVTANTILRRDLNCHGDGLSVNSGVRLNLANHTIRGDGTGAGITANGGDGTVIANGTIRGFAFGMFPGNAVVTHVRVTQNSIEGVDIPADGGCLSLSGSVVDGN